MQHLGVKPCQIVLILFLAMLSGLSAHDMCRAESTRPILIGALNTSWGPTPQVVGLRDGLMALGYRENEQFVIGVRFTQGDVTALPEAARSLVESGVDIIFADHVAEAKAAQEATNQIPIVCASLGDPVGSGLVQSFARPGGNITGVADLQLELGPKRLEIFREMIPQLTRVLFPYQATHSYAVAEVKELRAAASHLEIILTERSMHTQEEAQAVFAAIRQGEIDGIMAPRCCGLNIPGYVLDATAQLAIPTMFEAAFWVERGTLASYGLTTTPQAGWRRAWLTRLLKERNQRRFR